ncbi:MAG: DNA-directed RNA polymerase subunit alpha [Candidatus Peregrinibacteria bacterium]|nr:DNA-directed RNA polymerase subunit alpha [Candidatus Peregrinibacteria bacterium]
MHILHNEIGAPRLKIKSDGKTSATLTITPLPSGYGMTLGNALRRVLLSSLPGTAVTAVKIDGISHEYTTVPGLKDSVLDITLNLRSLKLRKHSKEVEEVEIPLKKSGTITAKDLKVSSDIEILDPSQVITTCDGASTKKKMKIRVEKGVGYKLILNTDSVEEDDPEYVLIDSNFSPITLVKYEVKPARVADQTNLDQLTLQVETNGSIEAEKAIKLAAGIIESYFNLFNEKDAYSDEDFTTTFDLLKQQKEAEASAQSSPIADSAFTPIDILGLSQRTLNSLVNGNITSVEQLVATPMAQLSQLRGFGSKAKTELEKVLSDRGYTTTEVEETNEK